MTLGSFVSEKGMSVGTKYEPAPVSPGDVLRENIIAKGITQEDLAEALDVSRVTVNQIVNDRRAVTADMALRLARVLSTTPDFWLNLQQDVDIYRARRRAGDAISKLPVLRKPRQPSRRFIAAERVFGNNRQG
jgi:addiction module HigA family antidote